MNSITYISMGVNYDEAKAFVNEIQRQIKKYCRIIKKVKKEDKNKIYYFTKEQIKKSKKECRRLKIKYIFNEKFPVFFDIIDINHVIIHMLIIEKQDMPYFQYLSDLIQKLRIIVLYRLQLIMG